MIPRQMNGLINLVNSENVLDGATGLTEALMLDAMQSMWTHGASGEYYVFVNKEVKLMINSMLTLTDNSVVNTYQGLNQSLGITVSTWETDFGIVHFILDRYIEPSTMLILDLDQVQIAELRGTFFEMLPSKSDVTLGHVLNESTIKLLNSYSGAKIINIPIA